MDENGNDELTLNVTGWLFSLLGSDRIQVTGKEAEYLIQSRQWLAEVNRGQRIVVPRTLGEPGAQESEHTPTDPQGSPSVPAH